VHTHGYAHVSLLYSRSVCVNLRARLVHPVRARYGALPHKARLIVRLVVLHRRGGLAKFHFARQILKIGIHRERKSKIIRKEILCRDLAHVYAHTGATRILEVPTFGNLHAGIPFLDRSIFSRNLYLFQLAWTNQPLEKDSSDPRVELTTPLGRGEELPELGWCLLRHDAQQYTFDHLPLLLAVTASHDQFAHVNESLVVCVKTVQLPLAGHLPTESVTHLLRKQEHEGPINNIILMLHLLSERVLPTEQRRGSKVMMMGWVDGRDVRGQRSLNKIWDEIHQTQ